MKLIIAGLLLTAVTAGYLIEWQSAERSQTDSASHTFASAEAMHAPDIPGVPVPPDLVDYTTQIEPLLNQLCYQCHGALQQAGGVRLDEHEGHWKNSSGQDLITLTDPSNSPLLTILSQKKSPAHHRLTADQRSVLTRWIDEGAAVPRRAPQKAADWSLSEHSHWAFQPLQSPPVPSVRQVSLVRNPIDAFVLSRLEQQDIAFGERASTTDLVRRLSFTITGLPPSEQLVHRTAASEYSAVDNTDVWEDLVDELLGRTAYGEHVARHWLDVVRYADTNGYEHDSLKPFVWKYRDFVIRALNDDVPYDELIRMQIAGDLNEEPTDDDFIATGFLRLGAWDSEPEERLQAHFDSVDDMVATTGVAFLGLTVGCARCHDHPLEPISSRDYTRMTAAFHGLFRPVSGRLEKSAPSATPEELAKADVLRTRQSELQRTALLEDSETRASELRRKAAALEDQLRFDLSYRFIETDVSLQKARRLRRGDSSLPAEFVAAGPPSILCEQPVSLTSGDQRPRQQLAEWFVNEGRALTARVIVNRIWQWHFGHGLCETPNNLGLSGSAPTHPELLDWLAYWFVNDADWSLKKLHRLILTSSTFCRTSEPDSPVVESRRRFYASFRPRRLRAEMLYDAMLKSSGLLSAKMYGKPDYPQVSDDLSGVLSDRGKWAQHTTEYRRAIYLVVQRNLPVPILQAFGFPDTTESCSHRQSIDTAQQALMLWNGSLAETCAEALADRVMSTHRHHRRQQIDLAFCLVTGRYPDQYERNRLLSFFDQSTTDSESKVMRQLCLVLYNLDEVVVLK